MAFHIGTSGWSYDHWQGIAYPERTPVVKRLSFYVQMFGTVEANNTFYHWPPDSTFRKWREQLPPGFMFTAKAPRALTHHAQLHNPEEWLPRILSGMNCLGDNKGVLLVQLAPSFHCNLSLLDNLLRLIPADLRVAVEVRHASWEKEDTYALLAEHNAAYCVMSGAKLPCNLRATATFVYVRFHGPDDQRLYAGCYSDDELTWWSERMREWEESGRDVFAYFNNDMRGYAIRNAETLTRLLM